MDRCKTAPDAWTVVIPNRFAAYVTWADFQTIQVQLRTNAKPFGRPNPYGPPREEPALLQGRVMCGRCGSPMYVRYNGNHLRSVRARYVCVDKADARRATRQSVPAIDIDAATARLILDLMTPMAIEMTLAIQSELDRRVAQGEQHHQLRFTRPRTNAMSLVDASCWSIQLTVWSRQASRQNGIPMCRRWQPPKMSSAASAPRR